VGVGDSDDGPSNAAAACFLNQALAAKCETRQWRSTPTHGRQHQHTLRFVMTEAMYPDSSGWRARETAMPYSRCLSKSSGAYGPRTRSTVCTAASRNSQSASMRAAEGGALLINQAGQAWVGGVVCGAAVQRAARARAAPTPPPPTPWHLCCLGCLLPRFSMLCTTPMPMQLAALGRQIALKNVCVDSRVVLSCCMMDGMQLTPRMSEPNDTAATSFVCR